ncbi:MAG: potassium transporter [Gammaproteobacteria bacterium]|nr:MAG: potassium transporter [Gammaproteobacteria bacterium]
MISGFLQQAVVYLGAAVIAVPLVKRFNLSAVLGYLLAGVIVGPYLLGLVGTSEAEREHVMHFAEFGVVMMLFLIGLELRPAHLWQLRAPILGMGGLQVVLTTLILSVIGVFLGFHIKAAIAIGMILSLSSTAIVLQTLEEKGIRQTPAGKNIFSVLLFQDISVIPMLAILPLLATYTPSKDIAKTSLIAEQPTWLQVTAVLASIVVIVVLGHFVLRHIFRWVAATHIHELFTALTLFIIIGIALLMETVGLSPALGTFIAGVVLAESEYRHQIELDIAPFKGLLLGLLFMSVGASIDFNLFKQSVALVIALVFSLMLIKLLVLLVVAELFKMNITKKMLFSFSLAQAGEFAFVLFAMSISLNVLPVATVKLLVLVVALSMMLTPVLLILLDRVILPKVANREQNIPEDSIDDTSNSVIIAGYGRFGQIIGRLLKANGIESTVLDFNSDHVQTIRRFGQQVYYGDATRLDLLESAGAKSAKILIVAIADREKSVALVKRAREAFPHLRIFVRATSRRHAYELIEFGVEFERETLLSALQLGENVLTDLGYHPYRAKRATKIFHQHDNEVLRMLYPSYLKNHKEYIESSKENERIIAQILRADMTGMEGADYGWSVVSSDEDTEQVITDEKS